MDSEYVLGTKYGNILNVAGNSQYVSVTQRSEYARICLDRVPNICFGF